MKKVRDPLWTVVGEDVRLQSFERTTSAKCPECHVRLEIPEGMATGDRVRCGLCGAVAAIGSSELVPDDGSRVGQVGARLAE